LQSPGFGAKTGADPVFPPREEVMAFRALQTEMVSYRGHNGDVGEAYYARPSGPGPFPGVVVIHHMPGWDEWTCEVARKLAHHGYAAIAPSLYFRVGDGALEEVVAKIRAGGGIPDAQMLGDVTGAMAFLRAQPHATGKVGAIGFCSGGRQAYICACKIPDLDCSVDCWGGNVVVDDPSKLTPGQPTAPIDMTESMSCPLLGLFGNEDPNPTAAQVDNTEDALKRYGKTYEYYRYDGAGHAFFAHYRPNYRVEQAIDGWNKVFAFFAKHLGK
jgi:carboxymethylenebutenolidase